MLKTLLFITTSFTLSSCSSTHHDDEMDGLEGRVISSLTIVPKEGSFTADQQKWMYSWFQSRKGTLYSQSRIDQDLRDSYASGLIDDIQIYSEEDGEKVKVIAQIDARPRF